MLLGVLGCAAMGVTAGWLAFLVVFVLAKVGYSSRLVFYDAMLLEVTTDERRDTVSSMGYAYGYIGSVIPFILCLLLGLFGGKIGIGTGTAMVCLLYTSLSKTAARSFSAASRTWAAGICTPPAR